MATKYLDENGLLYVWGKIKSYVTTAISNLGLGTLSTKNSASGKFTPSGTVGTPTITVTMNTATVNSITDVGTLPTHGADTFTAGTLPSYTRGTFSAGTAPSWSASVANETLSFSWSAGTLPSHAADTFSAGSLPSFTQGEFSAGSLPTKGSNQTVATTVKSATSTQPSFTGTEGTVTVS